MEIHPLIDQFALHYDTFAGDVYTLDTASITLTAGTLTANKGRFDQGLWCDGTTGSTPTSGAGTRLMWIPDKYAFRAGRVTGSEWDAGSIGDYSFASGLSNTASGSTSFVGGGSTNVANGLNSFVGGGVGNTANGQYSFVGGGSSAATSGAFSFVGGGVDLDAVAYAVAVFGRNNVGGGTTDSWVATDPLFEIGIGADIANRANALTITKNGNFDFHSGDLVTLGTLGAGATTVTSLATESITGAGTTLANVSLITFTSPGGFTSVDDSTSLFTMSGSTFFFKLKNVQYMLFNNGAIAALDYIRFNPDGEDIDTRFSGNSETNLLYLDAGNDRVGIGTATPDTRFQVVGVTRLGADATNYSEFEADGTLEFNGAATVWNDLVLPLDSAKVPAANAPSWESFVGNLNAFAYQVNDFQEFTAELLHGYKTGSTLEFHIHGALNATTAQEEKVQFEIEYSVADMDASDGFGDVFPDGSGSLLTAELVVPNATADLTNVFLSIGTDSSGSFAMGATIKGRIRRIAKSAGGNELTGDIFVTQVGVHYEIDTVGSRAITTK